MPTGVAGCEDVMALALFRQVGGSYFDLTEDGCALSIFDLAANISNILRASSASCGNSGSDVDWAVRIVEIGDQIVFLCKQQQRSTSERGKNEASHHEVGMHERFVVESNGKNNVV